MAKVLLVELGLSICCLIHLLELFFSYNRADGVIKVDFDLVALRQTEALAEAGKDARVNHYAKETSQSNSEAGHQLQVFVILVEKIPNVKCVETDTYSSF